VRDFVLLSPGNTEYREMGRVRGKKKKRNVNHTFNPNQIVRDSQNIELFEELSKVPISN